MPHPILSNSQHQHFYSTTRSSNRTVPQLLPRFFFLTLEVLQSDNIEDCLCRNSLEEKRLQWILRYYYIAEHSLGPALPQLRGLASMPPLTIYFPV
jgi:hypothetical protein